MVADDAGKGRAHQAALKRRFDETTRPEVDVIHVGIDLLEPIDDGLGHFPGQVFELLCPFQVASGSVLVVGLEAVVPTTLDVQGCQVEAGEGNGTRLEQMVRHLSGDELVQVLHGGDKEAAGHFVHRLDFHEHLRVEEAVAEEDGRLLLEGGVHSGEEGADEGVAEPVGGSGELVEDPRVAVGIVAVKVALREEVKAV